MRIVIDLQGAQTASRFRGIGRYSLSLVLALADLAKEKHEIILALNGNLLESIDVIKQAFSSILPAQNIRLWYGPEITNIKSPHHEWSYQNALHIREYFLASLKPDVLWVTSLFEGFNDDAITSIHELGLRIPTAVSFYDLIPLIHPKQYLDKNPRYAKFYCSKVEQLKRADCFLAISNSAIQELQQFTLGHQANIAYVPCATDAVFRPKEQEQEFYDFSQQSNIQAPFILYSGGVDARKNVYRLIQAYSQLPKDLQERYQLVIAGKVSSDEIELLRQVAPKNELVQQHLIFTGYVSDFELAMLYRHCTVFVLPSLHEGFGLPALEAMACGAAVIGSNTTSIPEVVGREDALFNPLQVESITQKLTEVLTDSHFQQTLKAHGLIQATQFSWQLSARNALHALEQLHDQSRSNLLVQNSQENSGALPSLAIVTPMPPEKTGIALYTAQLLPALARHFEVTLVVEQSSIDKDLISDRIVIQDSRWLLKHGHQMDYVVYQFGNSLFHGFMFDLLDVVPGVVVLHDFFLSDLLYFYEISKSSPHIWTRALFHSHGYSAVLERYSLNDPAQLKSRFPVNLELLEQAQGVIVHSQTSKSLARQWYGEEFSRNWQVLPLVREKKMTLGREKSREILGFSPDDYIVCSFGFLDEVKLNHMLLEAWLSSSLSKQTRCQLIFVGENQGGDYGIQMLKTIEKSGLAAQIQITGWTDERTYQLYLEATDCAVQLRQHSRGETSAAVLDCLCYGVPTISNAHGSLAELPASSLIMLDDQFTISELSNALELLSKDRTFSKSLSNCAKQYIEQHHSPAICAKEYVKALELIKAHSQIGLLGAIQSLAALPAAPSPKEAVGISQSLMQSFAQIRPQRLLLLDITAIYYDDLKTGIERTARALMRALIEISPKSFRIEPVYLSQEKNGLQYRYARAYTLNAFNCPTDALSDDIVEVQANDVLLTLDLSGARFIQADKSGLLTSWRHQGVKIYSILYDILPLQFPHLFPRGMSAIFQSWLEVVLKNQGVFCISRSVAQDFTGWLTQQERSFAGAIKTFHLGADLANSISSKGLPPQANEFLQKIAGQLNFVMVGTIEPRKAHLQVLQAFDQLWEAGFSANLIIVGKEGWHGLPIHERRSIPETIQALKHHPKREKTLFWLSDVSDEFLESIYASSQCLIAASEGEGFGLPIIEAGKYGLSVIARDIAVFREVGNQSAFYFSGASGADLASAILEWYQLFLNNQQPLANQLAMPSWLSSAQQILDLIKLLDESSTLKWPEQASCSC